MLGTLRPDKLYVWVFVLHLADSFLLSTKIVIILALGFDGGLEKPQTLYV
jgi:hypothetical protein